MLKVCYRALSTNIQTHRCFWCWSDSNWIKMVPLSRFLVLLENILSVFFATILYPWLAPSQMLNAGRDNTRWNKKKDFFRFIYEHLCLWNTTTTKSAALWVQMIFVVDFTHGGLTLHIFDMIGCNLSWQDAFWLKCCQKELLYPSSLYICVFMPLL